MNNRLFKTTSILAFFTLISRVLGFMRDVVFAQMFGASATVDAFLAANKVLSSFRGFLEGPLSQIFIPILSEYRKKKSHAQEKYLFAATVGTLGFCVFIIVCFGIVLVPYLLKIITPGLEPYRFNLASYFLKITFPYLIFISFCGLGVAVMNTYDYPLGVALTPVWLSISLISAALWFSHYFVIPTTALAWGVLFGGVLQALFVIRFLRRVDLLAWPRIDFYDPGVRRILNRMLPAVVGASAAQVGMLINTNLASFLPIGTISWVYYADRLIYFPLSIIGISLSTALLRPLSQYYAENNMKSFDQTLGWSLRANIFVALPYSILIAMLAGPATVTLFMRGAFTVNDVLQTQSALMGYVLGLSAFMLNKTLITALYTQQDTKSPVKVVILGAISNVLVGLLLIPKISQAGITMAGSIGGWVQVLLMFFWIKRPINQLFNPSAGLKRWLVSLAGMTMALVAFFHFATPPLACWLEWNEMTRWMHFALLNIGTIIIVAIAAWYSKDFTRSAAF